MALRKIGFMDLFKLISLSARRNNGSNLALLAYFYDFSNFVTEKTKAEYGITAKNEPKKAPKPVPPKPTKKAGQEEPKFVLKPKDKDIVEGN